MKHFVLVLILSSPLAWSETPEAGAPAPETREWESSAELSASLTAGNTEVINLGLGASTKYEPKPWVYKGKGSFLTNSVGGTQTAQILTLEARAERRFSDSLGVFVQVPYFKNRLGGFDMRLGVDAGVDYTLLDSGEHKITTEGGFGFLREERTDGTGQSFGTLRVAATYKWKFSSSADLESLLSFMDNLSNTADWRLSSQTSVSAVLTNLLSLKVSLRIDHLNTPVTGKKNTDLMTSAALVAKF